MLAFPRPRPQLWYLDYTGYTAHTISVDVWRGVDHTPVLNGEEMVFLPDGIKLSSGQQCTGVALESTELGLGYELTFGGDPIIVPVTLKVPGPSDVRKGKQGEWYSPASILVEAAD